MLPLALRMLPLALPTPLLGPPTPLLGPLTPLLGLPMLPTRHLLLVSLMHQRRLRLALLAKRLPRSGEL